MKKIPPTEVANTFGRLREEYPGYIQLQFSNGSWCVRHATSVWDKKKKKTRKIAEHLGVISTDGKFKKKIPRNAIRGTNREIFQYGNGTTAYHFLKDVEVILEELTPYNQEIIAYAIIKLIDSKPLRLLASGWEKLYLSREKAVSLSPKHISSVLKDIGTDVSSWYELFSQLTFDGDIVLYDLSRIFTYSENIKIAEKGYNNKRLYLNQIGVTMAFSSITQLPIGIEIFPGSMKETKIIRDFRKRFPKTDMGYIFDRGFTDYTLLDELKKDNTHYIIPLKKDSKYMDLRWARWNGPFVYRNRPVLWSKKKSEYGYTYFFDDPKVRGEQETALLKHVEKGEITLKEFEEKRKLAGIMGILSDFDRSGKVIYDLYKGREDVELAFDALNNAVDSDKTYLRSEESVRGYYFISFIALRGYFSILKRLREKELTSKISVEEVLFELSKVEKIVERSGKEYYAKIPKRAGKIMKLFPEIFTVE
ncbi:MAG: transposase [Candidatus Thermoplasmatota archaeon]|nr:transposase [Candidatus Thermoplasmatota archaeon]